MKHTSQLHSLLVEIMVVVLFFSLCCTVILEVFAAAWNQNRTAEDYNAAMLEGQNLADRLYVSEDEEALLSEEGFALENGAWSKKADRVTYTVTLSDEPGAAGSLQKAEIIAANDSKTLLTLQVDRFVQGGLQNE